MTDAPLTADAPDERSLALFQRSADPLFLLNRQRRIRFTNPAFQHLVGLSASDLLGLVCTRRKGATALARSLCPPSEVLAGQPARVRRSVPPARVGPPWWEVFFLPLRDTDGVYSLVGRVTRISGTSPPGSVGTRILSEPLLALRDPIAARHDFDLLTGDGPVMSRLTAQARLAAMTRVPVLLVGPAGSGKRTVARVIHHQGQTRARNFMAIDTALPASSLGLVLFGLNGLASPARLGTLYLREPARMPRDVQARLAEWITERGEDSPRIVAGTRGDPAEDVRAGRLLPELHQGLAVLTIDVPALRDRRSDLTRLALGMLERARSAGLARTEQLSAPATDCLLAYHWPGNLRELDAVLAEASRAAESSRIDLGHLPADLRRAVMLERQPSPGRPKMDLKQLLESTERRLIEMAMKYAGGRQEEAAELLGVPRAYLWRYFKSEPAKKKGKGEPTEE